MKTFIKTGFASLLLLLAISCKKESNTIQSSATTDNSLTGTLLTDVNGVAGDNAIGIGTQRWRTQNLDVSRYNNGDKIPEVRSAAKWAALTTGAWCWYKNDSANGAIYGKLYNWYAVNDPRGIAPAGWHIPTNAELDTLSAFLGGQAVAGGKLKETGTTHWLTPNTDASDSSGFAGLPGGSRASNGTFDVLNILGSYGGFWSSTADGSLNALNHYLLYNNGTFNFKSYRKQNGFSVRCVRD